MFNYKALEAIVFEHCKKINPKTKKVESRFFENKNDLTRALLSTPSSVSLSTLAKSATDTSIYDCRRGIGLFYNDIISAFSKATVERIADNFKNGVGNLFTYEQQLEMANEMIQLVNESENLTQKFKDQVAAIDYRHNFPLFFATLLSEAILSNNRNDGEKEKQEKRVKTTGKIAKKFHLPPVTPWFCGREGELSFLHQHFQEGNLFCVIYGQPGFGKTQLARQYAYANETEYASVFWIDAAGGTETIISQYTDFLMENNIKAEGLSANLIFYNFSKLLSGKGKNLIVYDNADFSDNQAFNDLNRIIPQELGDSNIIITSRNYRIIRNSGCLELSSMSEDIENAKLFLMTRSGDKDDENAALLAQRLSYHPLAMEIAGAYIANTPDCNLKKYIEWLDEDIVLINRAVEITDYNQTISQILDSSLHRITTQFGQLMSDCVGTTLFLLSFCMPDGIDPKSLARFCGESDISVFPLRQKELTRIERKKLSLLKDKLLLLSAYIKSSPINMNDIINILFKFAFVSHGEGDLIVMHDLLCEIMQNKIPLLDVRIALYDRLKSLFYENDELYSIRHRRNAIQQAINTYENKKKNSNLSKYEIARLSLLHVDYLDTNLEYQVKLFIQLYCKQAKEDMAMTNEVFAAIHAAETEIDKQLDIAKCNQSKTVMPLCKDTISYIILFMQHIVNNKIYTAYIPSLTIVSRIYNRILVTFGYDLFYKSLVKWNREIDDFINCALWIVSYAVYFELHASEIEACLPIIETLNKGAMRYPYKDNLYLEGEHLPAIFEAYNKDDLELLPEIIKDKFGKELLQADKNRSDAS